MKCKKKSGEVKKRAKALHKFPTRSKFQRHPPAHSVLNSTSANELGMPSGWLAGWRTEQRKEACNVVCQQAYLRHSQSVYMIELVTDK
jgi:hypothetical protein